MESKRTTLGDALHQSGEWAEAEKWFREAEEIQKKRLPRYPFLYSLQGFRFCDLLLDHPAPGTGNGYDAVTARAEKTIEIAKRNNWLLDIALDHLTLGRAAMMRAMDEPGGDLFPPRAFLEKAVTGLREAGAQEFLTRGLLARAECLRRMKSFDAARDDLEEAREIAELGDMKLFLCDYHLEAVRLCRDEGDETGAAEHERLAEELIEKTGYGGRKKRNY